MTAPDHILTNRHVQPDELLSLTDFVRYTRRGQRRAGAVSNEFAPSPVVQAHINHGRWIGSCPFCGGAELVDPADLRFWCLSCDMQDTERQWLRVTLPADRAQIERELLKRPHEANRNWAPGETVAKLRRENAANEVK